MVVWRMRAPEKMPLVRKEKQHGIIRRASDRRQLPLRELAKFQNV